LHEPADDLAESVVFGRKGTRFETGKEASMSVEAMVSLFYPWPVPL
jgi:hypothetical protein